MVCFQSAFSPVVICTLFLPVHHMVGKVYLNGLGSYWYQARPGAVGPDVQAEVKAS